MRTMRKRYLLELIGVVVGTAFMALSFQAFLVPNQMAAGGVSGLGVILFHLYAVPVGLTVFLVNIPLFILAWVILGWKVVANSLAGTILLPLMLEVFAYIPVVTQDMLLASVFGGIGVGIGLGLVFRSHGSTGGTALGALLISHFSQLSSGKSLIGADLAIILASGFVFSAEAAMFALISLFVTSKVIDLVQEGLFYSKAAIIISDENEVIADKIMAEIGRGATFLKGSGAYTGERREIMLCVLSQSQVTHIKDIVREIDPDAFVIVSNVGEVLGEGFRRI